MHTVGKLVADPGFFVFARFAVIAFFAVTFLQSGLNKLFDSEGNLSFLREHFKGAPTLAGNAGALFWGLTILELLAGVFCGLGILTFGFVSGGFFARWGLRFATLALLALLFGQRLAKDYAGAAVVAAYFAVAILGLFAFAIR
jgi:putative oxidoreductase